MRVIESLSEWRNLRLGLKAELGLVPTMGALHEGHLSLVRRAREENEHVTVWIFVNPKQFGANEDFGGYPRTMEQDLALLKPLGVDTVLAPKVEEVYPPGFQTTVALQGLTQRLEGSARAGHFDGVTTVVCKMFCLTQCRRAYFGQKDAQQSLVVGRMAADLGLLMDVVVCPTVREPDGLAMSSRNAYLQGAERPAAAVLHKGLQEVAARVGAGERDCNTLREALLAVLAKEPLANVEYVSIADPATLDELQMLDGEALVSLAVRIGRARLIDNIRIHTLDAAPLV